MKKRASKENGARNRKHDRQKKGGSAKRLEKGVTNRKKKVRTFKEERGREKKI